MGPILPKPQLDSRSQDYLMWEAGARAEHEAANEGLRNDVQDARDVLVALARQHEADSVEELLTSVARIYCPDRLRRRFRKIR